MRSHAVSKAQVNLIILILIMGLAGCEDHRSQRLMEQDCLGLAQRFTRELTGREYEKAYALTSASYRSKTGLAQMKQAFEKMVPLDWGETEPVEVRLVTKDWPAMRRDDVAVVYASIYGDVYSEAVILVFGMEGGRPMIREVEFGRP